MLASLLSPDTVVRGMSFSDDGQLLGFTRESMTRADPEDERVQIWNWRGDDVVAELDTKAVDIRFDPSGRYVATAGYNKSEAEVWNATTFDRVSTLSGSETQINSVGFSADGDLVVTGAGDGTIRVWEPATGVERQRLDAGAAVTLVAFAPDGRSLLSTDESGVARVWTLDLDTLIDIAEARATRRLTEAECLRYLGDACPTP